MPFLPLAAAVAALLFVFGLPIAALYIQALRVALGAEPIGPVPPPRARQDFADLRDTTTQTNTQGRAA